MEKRGGWRRERDGEERGMETRERWRREGGWRREGDGEGRAMEKRGGWRREERETYTRIFRLREKEGVCVCVSNTYRHIHAYTYLVYTGMITTREKER